MRGRRTVNKMHWILQKNLYNEKSFDDLCNVINRLMLPHTFIDVVPFSHEIIPDIGIISNPIICMGSTSLAFIAKEKGWSPGAFWNDDFNYYEYIKMYGSNMLNDASLICKFEDIPEDMGEFFIRPNMDLKAFSGTKMTKEEVIDWKHRIIKLREESTFATVTPETLVVVAPLKKIMQEYRFFVVDGKVITGSRYKVGDRVIYSEVIDQNLINYTQMIADIWVPSQFCAIDIAYCRGEFKVLEVNCATSAGMYAADVFKIVEAIERM